MSTLLRDQFAPAVVTYLVPAQGFDLLSVDSAVATDNEISELETTIERCSTTIASLEAIAASIGDTQAEGGLSVQGAVFAQQAISAACDAIDLPVQHASLESFQEEGGRAAATTYSMEMVMDGIKKAWAAVMNFVKGIIRKVKEFAANHASDAGRLESAATGLSKKVETKDGSPEKAKLKVSGSQAAALTLNGKQDAGNLDSLISVVSALESTDAGIKFVEGLTELLLETTTDVKDKTTLAFAEGNAFDVDLGKELSGDDRFKSTDAVKFLSTGEVYAGDKILVASKRLKNDVITGITFKLESTKATASAKNDKEVELKALSGEEVIKSLDAVAKVAKAVKESKLDYSKRTKAADKALVAGDKLIKRFEKADGELSTTAKDVLALAKGLATTIPAVYEPGKMLESLALRAAKAQYTFAKNSLGNLKVAKD